MSQENVDIMRRNLEAAAVAGMRIDGLDDRALERVVQVLHPEVEFREDPKFPEGSVFHGREAVRDYFQRFSVRVDAYLDRREALEAAGLSE
jgi:hypothetical protein